MGHPVNVVRGSELLGLPKLTSITSVEHDGLLLFALAVILGGVVFAGQALVRAVSAGAADLPTWRAMGADRGMAAGALVIPAALTAIVGACTALVVALGLSSRFPIGLARRLDLDVGTHADWTVLGLGLLALAVAVMGIALATAEWRVARGDADATLSKPVGEWTFRAQLPPALLIGSRLAVEPGRGTRAVPVRSALVGVIAGVIGVVGCFTFRAGLVDTATTPSRTGIVWNYFVASDPGDLPATVLATITDDRDVRRGMRARWARAVPIDGTPTPMFGTSEVKGSMSLVVLRGHAPRSRNEIAFGPGTLDELKLDIGDRVEVGTAPGHEVRVVGTALLPATSHTDYDHSAWMTDAGLREALRTQPDASADSITDFVLIRWRAGGAGRRRHAPDRRTRRPGDGVRRARDAAVGRRRVGKAPVASDRAHGVLRVAGHRDRRPHARHHRAPAPARPGDPPVARLHPPPSTHRHHVAGHAPDHHRPRGRDPARHRLRALALAMARRQLPGGVRAAARTGRDGRRRPDRDRPRVGARGAARVRGYSDPSRAGAADGVATTSSVRVRRSPE